MDRRRSNITALVLSLYLIGVVCGAQPEFAQPLRNVSVPLGRSASFSCVVTNLGGYRVGWVKADTKAIQAIHTHVITHNARVSVSRTDHNTWNLHINNVQEEDRGPYMCQINTDPMRSQIGFLEVTVPPKIIDSESTSDLMVPEGSGALLVCRARGHPKPTVTWQREDRKLIVRRTNNVAKPKVKQERYVGEVLNLTHITRSDMGPYLCIANNSVPPIVSKRIMVEVHFSPVVHVPNQLIGAPEGMPVTLKCNVEASPKSIQYWTRDDGTMLLTDNEYEISERVSNYYVTHMILRIPSFKSHHKGTYFCNAKNSIGEVSGHIKINEIIKPTEAPKEYDEIPSAGFGGDELSNHIPVDWESTSPAREEERSGGGSRSDRKPSNSVQLPPKDPYGNKRPSQLPPPWLWEPPASSAYRIQPTHLLKVFLAGFSLVSSINSLLFENN